MEQTYLSGTIQERIREQLKIKDMNQAELARIIGIGESTFSRFMSGGESAKLDHQYVIRMAREFKVSTDFLLGITNVPDRKNYRIDELGLTPMAARNLYTKRVNTSVVSYLLENPKFAFTTNRIARYLEGSLIAGMRSDMSRFWGLMPDDLAQEGAMALVKCVERFDSGLGNKFLTYAAPAIRNAMLDVIRKQEVLYTESDKEFSTSQTEMAEQEAKNISSDAYSKTPEQIYIKNESMAELHHALAQIRDREREYLYFRFGFDDEDVERTRKDTAEHFHITESSAKRTEITALDNVWLELPWWFHS